jgi:hypothetical protein
MYTTALGSRLMLALRRQDIPTTRIVCSFFGVNPDMGSSIESRETSIV